jgi:hypothetical protein
MGKIQVNDPIRPLALRSVLSPTALGRLTWPAGNVTPRVMVGCFSESFACMAVARADEVIE